MIWRALLCLTLTGLAETSGAATAIEILQQTVEAEKVQVALRAQYLFHEHAIHRQPGSNGTPGKVNHTQDYEIIYLEGAPYRKLALRNGKALSPKEARYEEEKLRQTAEERRQELAKRKNGPRILTFSEAQISDMLRLMDCTLLREEDLRGRKAWVIQCEPKKDVAAANSILPPRDAHILCYRYVDWIDQQDHVLAQQEIEVIREGVDSLPGSTTLSIFRKENNSPWFRRSIVGEFFTSTPKSHWVQEHQFSDFRKFDAQSNIDFEKAP